MGSSCVKMLPCSIPNISCSCKVVSDVSCCNDTGDIGPHSVHTDCENQGENPTIDANA